MISRNRRNVLELRDADHLPTPANELRVDFLAHLRSEGIDPTGWSVTLVTNLRVLGYVFNPASFFLCRDAAGLLRVVVVEVHNTYGDRHLYSLRRARPAGPFVAAMDKALFVSPFIAMDGRYSVHVQERSTGLRIAINERLDGQPLLSTSLVLERLAAQRSNPAPDAAAIPTRDSQDDRGHPLARPATLAQGGALPPPR